MPSKLQDDKPQASKPRPYLKPNLIKGPVLTHVTAMPASMSGGISTDGSACWVARAAFGETDIRWMIFRSWLLDDAPIWFRRLYIRHGEAVGGWLAGREVARRIVRALMMKAVSCKLR
jgi:hypothetical protein